MKLKEIIVRVEEYDDVSQCLAEDRELIDSARSVLQNSYSPYSLYRVGAAARLENGLLITGTNQENVAYPSGICAERVALFYAQSNHPGIAVTSLAISACSDQFPVSDPVTPCGACRQVIAEYETLQDRNIRIIMTGETGKVYVSQGIGNLMPLMFRADKLKKKRNH
jgi:cytidine deaminase